MEQKRETSVKQKKEIHVNPGENCVLYNKLANSVLPNRTGMSLPRGYVQDVKKIRTTPALVNGEEEIQRKKRECVYVCICVCMFRRSASEIRTRER